MATVGRLVIDLALGTAGLTAGLGGVQRQLQDFQNKISGVAQATAQKVADEQLVKSKLNLAVAQKNLEVSTLRVTAANAAANKSAVTVGAAEAQQMRATIALTEAQRRLAMAQAEAANPTIAKSANAFPFLQAMVAAAGLALYTFGADSFKAAAEFQKSMTLIETQAGEAHGAINMMSEALLNMAPSLQTGPDELAQGLYHIVSVGYHGADALKILATAAKGARIGNADLETTTNALVAVIRSGIDPTLTFDQAMGMLVATVGQGNLRMQDLASSMSSGVLSTAKQFGLHLLDVGAAMATMADQGIPAEEASTRLRITMALLAAPTKQATSELARVGLSQRDLADTMRGPGGLIGALTLLKEKMDDAGLDAVEQSMLLKNSFGGSRSSSGILILMNSLDLFAQKQNKIQQQSQNFGKAFATQSETADAALARWNATMEVAKIRIGNGLLPWVTLLVTAIGFVADKTLIVVPLLGALTVVVGTLAAHSLYGLVRSFLALAGTMAGHILGLIATRVVWTGLISVSGEAVAATTEVTAATQAASASMAELAATSGAATTALAGSVIALHGPAVAMLETTAIAGLLTTGLASVDEALVQTAVSTGPILLGFSGMDGVMLATAASTGPVIAGFNGIAGAIEATTASMGPILLGFAGMDGAMVVTEGSAMSLIPAIAGVDAAMGAAATEGVIALGAGLAETGFEVVSLADGIEVLVPILEAAAPAGAAAAAGIAAEGIAATAATPSMLALAAATIAAASPVIIVVAAIVLLTVAIIGLVTHFSEVVQGFRVVSFGATAANVAILDFASSIPLVGFAFKGMADAAHTHLESLRADIAAAQSDMDNGTGGLFGDNMLGMIDTALAKIRADAQASMGSLDQSLTAQFGEDLQGVGNAAAVLGADDMKKYADGIKSERQAPIDAFKELTDALANSMSTTAQIAQAYGILTSHELADGLASSDPYVVAKADEMQKRAIATLDRLTGGAYSAGTNASQSWTEAFFNGLVESGVSDQVAGDTLNRLLKGNPGEIIAQSTAYSQLGDLWNNKLKPSATSAAGAVDQLRAAIASGASASDQVAQMIDVVGYDVTKLAGIGETGGADLMLGMARGMKANQDAINTQLTDLHNMLLTSGTTEARTAYLLAVLQSAELAQGLNDSRADVREQAQGTRDTILLEMQRLVPGSFMIGAAAAKALGLGYQETLVQINPITGFTVPVTVPQDAMSKATSDYAAWLKGLEDKSNQAFGSISSQASSDLTTAFSEIKSKAMEFFDAVHAATLKAIRDAHDHKNALLDAKEALIQGPVDAAQKALDKQRKAIEEWRLRQAVAQAKTPEEQRDAILALQDFLAQQHIDDMQSEADAEKAKLEAQKKANDDQLQAQIDAENKRYEQQKKDFDRQLTALERFLKNHPLEWAKTQSKIMALLASYGISYKSAGAALGDDFVQGLRDQVKAAQDAAAALVKAGTPGGGGGGYGVGTLPTDIGGSGATGAIIGGAIGAGGVPSGTTYPGLPIYVPPKPAPAPTPAPHPVNPSGPGKAGGGPIYEGVPTWVGEAGKELYVPSTDGYLLDHASSLRAMEALTTMGLGLGRPSARPGATETPDIPRPVVRVDPDGLGRSGGAGGAAGKTTIVFQVGEEKFGELADLALYQQEQRQRRTSVTRVGSSRR